MKMRVGSVSRLGTVVASSQQEPQAERAVVQKEQQRSSAKRPNGKSKGCGGGGRYEDVLGKDLFKKETDIKQFIGKKVKKRISWSTSRSYFLTRQLLFATARVPCVR